MINKKIFFMMFAVLAILLAVRLSYSEVIDGCDIDFEEMGPGFCDEPECQTLDPADRLACKVCCCNESGMGESPVEFRWDCTADIAVPFWNPDVDGNSSKCAEACAQVFECPFNCTDSCDGPAGSHYPLNIPHNEYQCAPDEICCEQLSVQEVYPYDCSKLDMVCVGHEFEGRCDWCAPEEEIICDPELYDCCAPEYLCDVLGAGKCEVVNSACCAKGQCRALGICEKYPLPAIANFKAEHVRGEPDVNLSWALPDECDNIVGVSITRNGQHLPSLGAIEFYTDIETAWGTLYTYSISYLTADGLKSRPVNATILTGNERCQGVLEGDEFCVGNIRMECNASNHPAVIERCEEDSPLGSFICAGPNEFGNTTCMLDKNCEWLEDGMPFGIYSAFPLCCMALLDWSYYCFYDFSNTTVDQCYSCSQEMSCFGYGSESACSVDWCWAGNCSWTDSTPELGKGFCYEEGYEGEEYCELCGHNPDGDLFKNIDCTQTLCKKLGDDCYSDLVNDACEECSEARCDSFRSKDQCIGSVGGAGGTPITSNTCGEITGRSKDTCSLGVCAWDDLRATGKKCFKDGNADGVAECGTNLNCKNDVYPPETTHADVPFLIGRSGVLIDFIFNDLVTDFDSCLYAEGGSCCANYTPPFDMRKFRAQIEPVSLFSERITEEGVYYLKYYATDYYQNKELPKVLPLFIDIVSPGIIVNVEKESVFVAAEGKHKTDLTIGVVADEIVRCDYNLVKGLSNLPGLLYNHAENELIGEGSTAYNNSLVLEFERLNDGDYTFKINCSDMAGNSNFTKKEIKTDAYFNIHDVSPEADSILTTTDTPISFRTDDPSICTIVGTDNGLVWDEDEQDIIHVVPAFRVRQFVKDNRTYNFNINCLSAAGLNDTGNTYFTVDQAPPSTILRYKHNREIITETEAWFRDYPLIYFECEDSPVNGFNCNNTYYCLGSNCNPTTPVPGYGFKNGLAVNGTVWYYSVDKGGNREVKNKTIMKIDTNPPIVNYVNVSYNDIINEVHAEWGAEDNESGIERYDIKITDSVGNIVNGSNMTIYSDNEEEEIELDDLVFVPGQTYTFTVIAWDVAGWSSLPSDKSYDTFTVPFPPVCGDGIKDPGEYCDGDEVGGITCDDLGLGAGIVVCDAFCTEFDTSGCAISDLACNFTGARNCSDYGDYILGDAFCINNELDLSNCTSASGVECTTDEDCGDNAYCGANGYCVKVDDWDADSDNDGMPDWWEERYGLNPFDPADAFEDLDGDGASNLEEYLAGTDPTKASSTPGITDLDGDGLPDWWEEKYGIDDPNGDPDRDGLTNAEEYGYGTDPNNKDTDGDGFTDKDEIDQGYDPLDPYSHPPIVEEPKKPSGWVTFLLLLALLILGGGVYYLGAKYHQEHYAVIAVGIIAIAMVVLNYAFIASTAFATILSIMFIGAAAYVVYITLIKTPAPSIRITPKAPPPKVEEIGRLPEKIVHPEEKSRVAEELKKKKEELLRKRQELFSKFEEKPKEIKKEPAKKPSAKKAEKVSAKKEDIFDKLKELSKGRETKEDIFAELSKLVPKAKAKEIFEQLPKTKKDALKELSRLIKEKATKKEVVERLRKIAGR